MVAKLEDQLQVVGHWGQLEGGDLSEPSWIPPAYGSAYTQYSLQDNFFIAVEWMNDFERFQELLKR